MRLLLLRGKVVGAVLIGDTGKSRGPLGVLAVHVASHTATLLVVLRCACGNPRSEHVMNSTQLSFQPTTDLEEAVEHLILDRLDVGAYGPSLLDPNFELDHVFD